MNFTEKKLNSKTICSCQIFTVAHHTIMLPNQATTTRDLISVKHGASCVVAITKSKKIVLVKQFRYAINKILWEIPAGKQNFNETPLHCAKRELLEETGFKSHHWLKLGKLTPCPGYCNKTMHVFLAKNSFQACKPKPDPDEFVQIGIFNFDQIASKAASGVLTDTKTICAILQTHYLIINKTIKI